MKSQQINIFWFRRDLRTHDNAALSAATGSDLPVLPVFIFDKNILSRLNADDARLGFIHESLLEIHESLKRKGSGIRTIYGTPKDAWKLLADEYDIHTVFFNRDYEPYALQRDSEISELLTSKGIKVRSPKD